MELKKIRRSKGMSQREVADLLNCSAVVYSRYETGARQPSLEVLIKLTEIFGVTSDELIGIERKTSFLPDSFEKELLDASRKADERAREDALSLLRRHAE